MNALFDLIVKLAGLTTPTGLALQSLLQVTLVEVPNANLYFRFYEGQSDLDTVGKVDLRLPCSKAATGGPFLVVHLSSATLTRMDLEKRFGLVRIDDLSHHHPHFIGFSVGVAGRRVGFTADTTTEVVEALSFEFSEGPRH